MSDIATLKKQMETMTAALKELTLLVKNTKKSSASDDEPVAKPKRALSEGMKAWRDFQKRVAAVLKEGEVPLKNYAENMQFCSHLKGINGDYEDWDNDQILEERETWVKPEVSKLAAAGKTKRPPSSKSSVASSAASAVDSSDSESEKPAPVKKEKKPETKPQKEATEEKKPRGRPPKKAAASGMAIRLEHEH